MYNWNTSTPPYDDDYIVTCRGAQRAMSLTYENGKWTNQEGTEFEVIAWMNFPKAYDPKDLPPCIPN